MNAVIILDKDAKTELSENLKERILGLLKKRGTVLKRSSWGGMM